MTALWQLPRRIALFMSSTAIAPPELISIKNMADVLGACFHEAALDVTMLHRFDDQMKRFVQLKSVPNVDRESVLLCVDSLYQSMSDIFRIVWYGSPRRLYINLATCTNPIGGMTITHPFQWKCSPDMGTPRTVVSTSSFLLNQIMFSVYAGIMHYNEGQALSSVDVNDENQIQVVTNACGCYKRAVSYFAAARYWRDQKDLQIPDCAVPYEARPAALLSLESLAISKLQYKVMLLAELNGRAGTRTCSNILLSLNGSAVAHEQAELARCSGELESAYVRMCLMQYRANFVAWATETAACMLLSEGGCDAQKGRVLAALTNIARTYVDLLKDGGFGSSAYGMGFLKEQEESLVEIDEQLKLVPRIRIPTVPESVKLLQYVIHTSVEDQQPINLAKKHLRSDFENIMQRLVAFPEDAAEPEHITPSPMSDRKAGLPVATARIGAKPTKKLTPISTSKTGRISESSDMTKTSSVASENDPELEMLLLS